MSDTFELHTPFDPAAHPAPWNVVETSTAISVTDAAGAEIMLGDIEDREFFVFIVRAVNLHAAAGGGA